MNKYRRLDLMDEAARLLTLAPCPLLISEFLNHSCPFVEWDSSLQGIPILGKIINVKKTNVSDLSRYTGVLGILTFLSSTSLDAYIHEFLDLILQELHLIVKKSFSPGSMIRDNQELEQHVFLYVYRLCQVGHNAPAFKDVIMNEIWTCWIGLVESLNQKQAIDLSITVALCIGMMNGIQKSFKDMTQEQIGYLSVSLKQLLENETLLRIHNAANSVECASGTVPWYPEESHDSIFLGIRLFTLVETILYTFLNPNIHSWESLLLNSPVDLIPQQEYVKEFCSEIFKHCWYTNWPSEDIVTEEIYKLQTLTLRCSTLCCLFPLDHCQDFISNAVALLEDVESSVDLVTLVSTIEGLCIVAIHAPSYSLQIFDVFIKMLSKPSHLFKRIAESCFFDITRQTISKSIIRYLQAVPDPNLTKAVLFTFLKYFIPSQKTDDNHELLNALNVIVNLTLVLRPKEISETIIPAFSRLLESCSNETGKDVLEAIGNMCLFNNKTGFSDLIDILFKCESKSLKSMPFVLNLVALDESRSFELSNILLTSVLYRFMQKAVKGNIGIQDNEFKNELKEFAIVICSILKNPNFHPEEAQHDEMVYIYLRNLWFSLVLFIMNSDGLWPDSWAPFIQTISSKSPTLVMPSTCRSLEADLAACPILQLSLPSCLISQIQSNLLYFLPNKATEIKNNTPLQNVFVLSIYHLEMNRMHESNNLGFIFEYLQDDRLYQSTTYSLIEGVCELVIKKFFKIKNQNSDIEDALCTAVGLITHRLDLVRKYAGLVIRMVFDKFPGMIWKQELFNYTLQQLRIAVDVSMVDCKGKYGSLYVDDILELSERWVAKGCKVSSVHIFTMIQAYLANHSDYETKSYQIISNLLQKIDSGVNFQFLGSKLTGEIMGMLAIYTENGISHTEAIKKLSSRILSEFTRIINGKTSKLDLDKLGKVFYHAAAIHLVYDHCNVDVLDSICRRSIDIFEPGAIKVFLNAMYWLISCKPQLLYKVLYHLCLFWEASCVERVGIYSIPLFKLNAFENKMSYGQPTRVQESENLSACHLQIIRFLIDRFKIDRLLGNHRFQPYVDFVIRTSKVSHLQQHHWSSRETWFAISNLQLQVADALECSADPQASVVWTAFFQDTFEWFSHAPIYGSISEGHLLQIFEVLECLKLSTFSQKKNRHLIDQYENFKNAKKVLILLLENELQRLLAWYDPLGCKRFALTDSVTMDKLKWKDVVSTAWAIHPSVAIQLRSRFISHQSSIDSVLYSISRHSEIFVCHFQESLFLLAKNSNLKEFHPMRFLLFWTPTSPVSAIGLLSKKSVHPWVLQYAVRVLEYYPIDHVFFYVPQLVQALRYDSYGFIQGFILKAAKTSQLFAHQIIWNVKANMYKDEDSLIPDSLKPVLDSLLDKILTSFSDEDKAFYEVEFGFFKKITGISGTLKPLVQADATKAQKKKKIDEELSKIQVQVGVYLPTNPDSIVIDIDYSSGRPLQSHAKAPFMATFKVKDDVLESDRDRWMSSIFKVGDDCRQDVLALQVISIFKNIFTSAGLDLYVFPYRVLATEPGCGVIEVIPKSISRDMMGREKVNSLFDWYLAEFGNEASIQFQKAQMEFVKSHAAYSVISFILQIKDRHNGNIMFDKQGHIIHIDFGFILSIAPGGGILEVSPFKLTTEMVQVLGGDVNSLLYKEYSELCIKAYLACRPYADEIIEMVGLMMDSGLPCFKGEQTIRKLRERFQLDKSDRAAAEYMISLIRQSHENTRSGLYDRFQYLQNGIPFK